MARRHGTSEPIGGGQYGPLRKVPMALRGRCSDVGGRREIVDARFADGSVPFADFRQGKPGLPLAARFNLVSTPTLYSQCSRTAWPAMNRRKQHSHLPREAVRRLIAGADHASFIGRPLNVAVTIHWGWAGGPGGGTWRERDKRLRTNLRRWLGRKGQNWCAVWVVEVGPQGKDVHAHWAVHLSPAVPFSRFEAFVLSQLCADDPRVLNVTVIRDAGWMKYLLKGMAPDDHAAFGIPTKHRKPQGTVRGRRWGWTHNLGPVAIAARLCATAPIDASCQTISRESEWAA